MCILSLCTCVYVSLCICIFFIFHHLHLMTKIHSIKIWIPQNHCNAIVLLSKILNMCASEGSYSPPPPPPPPIERKEKHRHPWSETTHQRNDHENAFVLLFKNFWFLDALLNGKGGKGLHLMTKNSLHKNESIKNPCKCYCFAIQIFEHVCIIGLHYRVEITWNWVPRESQISNSWLHFTFDCKS